MSIKEINMIKMNIRNCLPEGLSYSEKCEILEKLAEEYRKKSRKDVYDSVKTKLKAEDYDGIIQKDGRK